MTTSSHWTQRTTAKSGAEEQELLAPLVAKVHGMREMAHQEGQREMPTARTKVSREMTETEMDEEAENQQEDNADQNRP